MLETKERNKINTKDTKILALTKCLYKLEITKLTPYMGITRSTLPHNNGNLTLPFFGGN